MKMGKRIISSLLTTVLLVSMFGCAGTEDDGKKDNIVLEEPVGVTADYDVVTTRDMYFTEVYSSSVNPVIKEYSFAKDQTFKKYGATPGSEVKPGDELVYSQTKSLDKEIADLEEELADLESYHDLQVKWQNENLEDAKKALYEDSRAYVEMAQYEPDENSDAYAGWAAAALMPEGSYKRALQNKERVEQNIKQTNELYELELAYKTGNIQRVRDKVTDATIVSDVTGEVVACNYYYSGDQIEKDKSVIAVGDTSQRVIQTEYISKANINKALDIYAIIDGNRYELEYVNMEPEEYTQKSSDGESVYTTFVLDDPSGTIQIGTYAAVIMVKDIRRGVLCVPNDAIKKESDGYYAYLYNGEETQYVPVEIGVRDGLYAEVLSGLSEGDKVLSSQVAKAGKNTAQVERGDYSVDVEINGFLYYPFSEWLTNPVTYGNAYFKEMLVQTDEKISEGQVLCTIEVIPDQIEIDRLNRKISRLQSRLVKLQQTKAENDAKHKTDRSLEQQIDENIRSTSQYQRQLSKLTEYSGIVEIKAPYAGIVMDATGVKTGDLLYSGAGLVEIANDSLSYVLVNDEKNQLNYGNEAEIKVSSSQGSSVVNGKVVSVSKMCLSKDLTNKFSIVAIPQEEIAAISGSTLIEGGVWGRNSFKVKVKIRSEKNVLTVPKSAVTLKDKSTYVTVVNEDGSVKNVSFIPGGSDNNYYWIAEGLTEGTTVCWE